MPWKKVGDDDYVSPSGRHWTRASIRAYLAKKGRGEAKSMLAAVAEPEDEFAADFADLAGLSGDVFACDDLDDAELEELLDEAVREGISIGEHRGRTLEHAEIMEMLRAATSLNGSTHAVMGAIENRISALKALPKNAQGVVAAICDLEDDDLDGLYVHAHPDGPKFWIDQMDWHNGKGGKVVIPVAEKATGKKAEEGYKHKEKLPDGAGVWLFNEGPKPPGDGWIDLIEVARPERKALAGRKPTAAVDLDATLAHYDGWKGDDHFGEPLTGAKEFLSDLAKTHRVLIFTARTKADDNEYNRQGKTPDELTARVRDWLTSNGLPFDDIYAGQGKPIADVYIDDRAVAVPPNPKPDDYAAVLEAVRRRSELKALPVAAEPADFELTEYAKAWNESRHHRDHGKFSSTGVASGEKHEAEHTEAASGTTDDSDTDSDTNPDTNPDHFADAKIRSLAARIKDVPAAVVSRVSTWIRAKYDKLAARYGPTGAKAVLAGMVLLSPTPIPGSSLIPIALAEAVKGIRALVSSHQQKAVPDDESVQALALDLLHELYEAEGEEFGPAEDEQAEDAPPSKEEVLDAAAEYVQQCRRDGSDPSDGLHRLAGLLDDPDELAAVLKGFDPNEKRDAGGKWAAGGGGAFGSDAPPGTPKSKDTKRRPRQQSGRFTDDQNKLLSAALAGDKTAWGVLGDHLAESGHPDAGAVLSEFATDRHPDADAVLTHGADSGIGADDVKPGHYRYYLVPFARHTNHVLVGRTADGTPFYAAFTEPNTPVQKGFDEQKHPRDDHGRFVSKEAIHAAKNDPKKADELRARVTNPDQRKKLEAALSGETDLGRTARGEKQEAAKQKREKVQTSRETAKAFAYKLLNGNGDPALYRELIPHLSALTGKELSHVRLMLGASFGGKRNVAERRQKLIDFARGKQIEAANEGSTTKEHEEIPARDTTPAEPQGTDLERTEHHAEKMRAWEADRPGNRAAEAARDRAEERVAAAHAEQAQQNESATAPVIANREEYEAGLKKPAAEAGPEATPEAKPEPQAPPQPQTKHERTELARELHGQWMAARDELAKHHGTRKINDKMTSEQRAAEGRIAEALRVLQSGHEYDGTMDLGPVSDARYAGYRRMAEDAIAALKPPAPKSREQIQAELDAKYEARKQAGRTSEHEAPSDDEFEAASRPAKASQPAPEAKPAVDPAAVYETAGSTAKHSEVNAAIRAAAAMSKAQAAEVLKKMGYGATGDPRRQLAELIFDRKAAQVRRLSAGDVGRTEAAKRAEEYRVAYGDEPLLNVNDVFARK